MCCVSKVIVWLVNVLYVLFFAVYRVLISTGYGSTTDKVSIILVGTGGTETGIHDLPGEFGSNRQVSVEKQATTATATRTSIYNERFF